MSVIRLSNMNIHTQGYIWSPEDYQLKQTIEYIASIPPSSTHFHKWNSYITTWNNTLYIHPGYRWNGCTLVSSGKALPYTHTAYNIAKPIHGKKIHQLWYASLIHDAQYDIIRIAAQNGIQPPWTRRQADRIFLTLALQSGVSPVRAIIYYGGLYIWTSLSNN